MFKQLDFRILAYSIVASLLLVSDNYFNYIGWFVFGVAQTCITLYFKNKRTVLDWFFGTIALLSALNFVFYTNFFTLLFSAIIYLYSSGWLINKLSSDRFMQVVHLIMPYLSSYTNIMQFKYKNDQPTGLLNDKETTKPKISETIDINPIKSVNWGQITFSIVVTAVVLSIILPLLSFANPQFGLYIKNLFELQWIRNTFDWLFENIFSFTMIFRVLVFAFVYNLLPKLISFCKNQKDVELEEKKDSELSIPKIVTVFTLFAFLAVQVQTTLNPSLLTKAAGDVANETFFQLSIVCFVAFGLIYLNYKDKLATKIWSLILLAQTLLLGMIAFHSNWSYVINWGLTHKRLYGFSVLGVVLVIIAVFGYFAYHNSRKLVQGLAVVFCLISVITNMVNMDKLIYENPPKEAAGVEQNYVNGLGLDAGNLKARYSNTAQKYELISKTGNISNSCSETNWLRNYNTQIQYLRDKYSTFRFLDWNYSEFINYLEVKDVNLVTIENPNTPVDSRPFNSVLPNCYIRGGQSQSIYE
jgi:hypothetical protein